MNVHTLVSKDNSFLIRTCRCIVMRVEELKWKLCNFTEFKLFGVFWNLSEFCRKTGHNP